MSASISSIGELEKLDASHAGTAPQDFPSSRQGKEDIESDGPKQERGSIEAPMPDSDEYPKGLTLFFLVLALSLGTFMMALDNVSFSALAAR